MGCVFTAHDNLNRDACEKPSDLLMLDDIITTWATIYAAIASDMRITYDTVRCFRGQLSACEVLVYPLHPPTSEKSNGVFTSHTLNRYIP
jgi:hypothetical protein